MNISFITYIAAAFVVLLEIGLVVLLISRIENRGSKLYRMVVCFAAAILLYCLLYFYFYFQDMLGNYAVGLSLRIIDYILDAAMFFFWIRLLSCFMSQPPGAGNTRANLWAWIIGIARAAVGVVGACCMDEYYSFHSLSAGTTFIILESAITILAVIVIFYYSMRLIRTDITSRHRNYVGFVSLVLCLWSIIQFIVDGCLYTGVFISAWAAGIPDSTAPAVFLIGLSTFLFVFREDFSPLFYAAGGTDSARPEAEAFADPIELAAAQHGLTVRELDVLRLVYEGKNNPEIAEELFISRNTVKKHLQSIYEKTGVNSRMELVYVVNLKKQ